MANKKGPVIGLTGQTGAGKSTAAALLRAQGLAVIDADEIARKVTRPGSFVLSALAAAFGADLILPDGSLNRPLLAQRAFSSPGQTARLNAITHPAIIQQMRAETACAFQNEAKAVVLDAPQPAIKPAHSTAAVASAAIFLNILFPPSILYRVLRRVTYQSDQTAQTRP